MGDSDDDSVLSLKYLVERVRALAIVRMTTDPCSEIWLEDTDSLYGSQTTVGSFWRSAGGLA